MGATVVSGIHYQAYQNLRKYLGLEHKEVVFDHYYQQLAKVDQEVVDLLRVDIRGASAHRKSCADPEVHKSEDGKYIQYTDKFGIGWQMPPKGDNILICITTHLEERFPIARSITIPYRAPQTRRFSKDYENLQLK